MEDEQYQAWPFYLVAALIFLGWYCLFMRNPLGIDSWVYQYLGLCTTTWRLAVIVIGHLQKFWRGPLVGSGLKPWLKRLLPLLILLANPIVVTLFMLYALVWGRFNTFW